MASQPGSPPCVGSSTLRAEAETVLLRAGVAGWTVPEELGACGRAQDGERWLWHSPDAPALLQRLLWDEVRVAKGLLPGLCGVAGRRL